MFRQITSKKHIRRQLRKAHEQSRHNRENTQTSHSQQAFIPRLVIKSQKKKFEID